MPTPREKDAERARKKPADPSLVEEVSELVRRLCVAQSLAVIYSMDHPMADSSSRAAFDWISDIIKRRRKPVVISMAEGKVLFDGLPVEEQNPLVSRFAKRLEEIHLNNVFFEPGLTLEELKTFHQLLAQGTGPIAERGGMIKLLKEAGVRHITTKEASYVLLTDEHRVVRKDAKVVARREIGRGAEDVNAEITRYMLGEVMKKAEEKKWLINEIKNNPEKMATRIMDGIELATSRAELGAEASGDSIETLLDNIRLVGQSMAQAGVTGDQEGIELEDAVLTLEKELQSRSGHLTSSKVAAGFVNEILATITSFSDQVKAKRVTSEFLRGETSLRKTAELLKNLSPDTESTKNYVTKMRDLLRARGVTEKDIDSLLKEMGAKPERATSVFDIDEAALAEPPTRPAPEVPVAAPPKEEAAAPAELQPEAPAEPAKGGIIFLEPPPDAEPPPPEPPPAPPEEKAPLKLEPPDAAPAEPVPVPAPRRPRKKTFDMLVEDGVARRLKGIGVTAGPELQQGVRQLVGFVDAKIKQKEKELRVEADRKVEVVKQKSRVEVQRVQSAQGRRELLLDAQQGPVLLWDGEGMVEYINAPAQRLLGLKRGAPLTNEVIEEIGKLTFPLPALPANYSEANGWEKTECKLLSSIRATVKDKDGRIIGAVLTAEDVLG